MNILTIPKNLAKDGLVLISLKELERLRAAAAEDEPTAKNIRRWSSEAHQLNKSKKLPKLNSLRDLR